jgi:hypothetical protein
MSQVQRIAIVMGQDLGYCRGVFRGIHAYAVQKKQCGSFATARPTNESSRRCASGSRTG